MNEWFEIFRAGNWTDSHGREHAYTNDDLDRIVSQYDPAQNEAPIVIGHPESNSPAYGWVKALKRAGDRLLALPHQVVGEFAEMVKQGLFKKRSISLTPDLRLVHVGFLGAVPPAVKGLKDIAFSVDSNSMVYEFAEWRVPIVGRVLRRLRDWVIEKFGLETADQVLPAWEIQTLEEERVESNPVPEFTAPAPIPVPEPAVITMDDAERAEFQRQVEALRLQAESGTRRIEELQAIIEKRELEQRQAEIALFMESLVSSGRITPAQKNKVLGLLLIVSGVEKYQFSEGGEQSPLTVFREFLAQLPEQVVMQELATGPGNEIEDYEYSSPVDPERLALHKKAKALAAEKKIPYGQAVREIVGIGK